MATQTTNPILEKPAAVDRTPYCRGEWTVVRCRETGFVFLANPPEYAQLEDEFAWEKTYEIERSRRLAAEPLASRVSWLFKKAKQTLTPKRNKIATLAMAELADRPGGEGPLRVLDVGCGWGDLLVEVHRRAAAAGRRVEPSGIEVSKKLAALSREKLEPLGGRVVCKNALDGVADFEPASLDLVVMSSYLEHERRPLAVLRRLRSALAPGGSVVLKVPNFNCWNRRLRGPKWCGFRYPDHVNYFTPRTLGRLAGEAGLTVSRQRLSDRSPLSDNMYAVLAKSEGAGLGLGASARAA